MEDIIAIRVLLESGESRYVLTWGRLFDAVDPAPIAHVVLAHAGQFSLGDHAVAASVCGSLQEAAREPFFHEALWALARQRVPADQDYPVWRREKIDRVMTGRDLWYLGRPDNAVTREPDARADDGYVLPTFDHSPPAPFEKAPAGKIAPWSQDELQCHRWSWNGSEWELSDDDAGPMRARVCDGSRHTTLVADARHLVCEVCGFTTEIESD